MEYIVATMNDYDEIICMKNKVKERIIKQELPIWLNGYPYDDMIQEDLTNGYGRVVKINDEIVAYSVFHPTDDEYPLGTFSKEPLMSFGRLMVKDGFTGKHIGDYLVKEMINEARTLNALGLGILADECNTKALNLYKKNGFKYETTKTFVYATLDVYTLLF